MTDAFPPRRVKAWDVLRNRSFSALGLIATIGVLILSLIQPAEQLAWLYRDNGIVIQHLQIVYLLLIPVLMLIFIFEPKLRRELRDAHALGVLALLSVAACFLLIRLLKPDEAWRFFRSAGFLWFVIIHALFLCALALLMALESPEAVVSPRTRRYGLALIALGGIVLAILHILSVGQFMGLDLNDEVWLGSLAANYAAHGAFYSPYLAGAFGNPDPFLPRYYLLVAEWIRLLRNSSFVSLRAFSLFAAGAGLLLTALILWRKTDFSLLQRVAGLVVMIGLSAFVRTSHNIRMDAGLAFYGALLLLGLLGYFQDGRRRWLVVCGTALIIGLEMIPPLALIMNAVIGFMLVGLALAGRALWRQVLIYGIVCTLGVASYLAIHFLPDVSRSVSNYLSYTQIYYGGGLGFDFAKVFQFGAFSAFLSPVEVIVIVAVVILGARYDRRLLLVFGAAALLVVAIRSASYGYLMVFTPFIAYFAAQAFRSQAAVTLGAFLLIPALLAVPIYDMGTAIETQPNQRELAEIDLLSWRVPVGSTVWAEPIFWLTLQDRITFIGPPGPELVASLQNTTPLEAAKALGVNAVICKRSDQAMCEIGAQLFGDPYEFNVTNEHYLMYSALGSK